MMIMRNATVRAPGPLSRAAERRFAAVLNPARLIRWVYVGRMSLATAILLAAFLSWKNTDAAKTFVVTLSFLGTLATTAASFIWSETQRRPLSDAFFYLQLVTDLLLVTAVVHVTDGQFAALYILVNAVAALVLTAGGALLVALLGLVLYVADALVLLAQDPSFALTLQLGVFALAGVGTSYIASELKAAGVGREALAAELRTVRLREADIVRNIRSGIVSVGENGELLFANAVAEELLGLPLAERIGTRVLDEIGDRSVTLASALRHAATVGTPTQARLEGELTRNGKTIPLGLTTTASGGGPDGSPRTVIAIFQDISDQKRLEQTNLRAQRLEAVAELAASLAHEIKNPLASIRSAVEQMAARPAASDDERVLGRLIVRESDRLARLLSEFLDFARVRVTRHESVDIGAVVRGAAALADSHPLRADGAVLTVDTLPTPLRVRGDEDLLHRAVFNLALNALQATRPGSTVRVAVGHAPPSRVPRGIAGLEQGAIVVDVEDSGDGIDPKVLERLFEPFVTSKVGGTGLGLAITHRAIEAHRGVVLVDAGAAGTRFSIFLPVGDDAAPGN